MSGKTPEFDSPPVIETFLGVEFDPLSAWDIPYFGLFWQQIREDYQQCTVQPPLASRLESFDDQFRSVSEITILMKPEVRCWYANDAGSWLMQVQNNHLLHNWRKGTGQYPRYEAVRDRFLSALDKFTEFVASEQLGELSVRQCEVTYINHIELDKDRNKDAIARLFPCWAGNSESRFLSDPEAVVLKTSYRLPDDKGRLHISMQPAIRHADLKRIIQLELSARVSISSDRNEIIEGLDLGHEWVVNGFADFTSSEMHDLWKRKQ